MEKHLQYKKKQIQTIQELLKNAKTSSENYKSSGEPFFHNDIDSKEFQLNYKSIPELPDSLNRHFKILYELIGDPEVEVYIGEWTIMSLNQCLERYKGLCNDGQTNVFDIGFRYAGMGHIEVLSCNFYNSLLFYRPDGGSNGWDREANYKEVVNFDYTKYDYLYFTQWLNKINKLK